MTDKDSGYDRYESLFEKQFEMPESGPRTGRIKKRKKKPPKPPPAVNSTSNSYFLARLEHHANNKTNNGNAVDKAKHGELNRTDLLGYIRKDLDNLFDNIDQPTPVALQTKIQDYSDWVNSCLTYNYLQIDIENETIIEDYSTNVASGKRIRHTLSEISIDFPNNTHIPKNAIMKDRLYQKLGEHLKAWNFLKQIGRDEFDFMSTLEQVLPEKPVPESFPPSQSLPVK